MSIATVAPEKFGFQDLVCIELTLRFDSVSGLVVMVEPGRGEDACVTLPLNPTDPTTIDVQVKGAAAPVTMADIAEILAHCPPREAADTLLERLVASPDRLALLVMSGRCDDSASAFAVPFSWNGYPQQPGRIKLTIASELLRAFGAIPASSGTKLMMNRKAHRDVVSSMSPEIVRPALDRVLVLERIEAADLEIACDRHLRTRHRIPSDRIQDVLNRLRDAVKQAKKEKRDAVALMRAVLAESAPHSLRPASYMARGIETQLVEDLSKKKCLLLSGPPRCGKTDVALWVAAEFQQLDYDVQQGGEIQFAERFLLEPTSGARIFFLDDPLGGSHAAPEGSRTIERLRALVSRLPYNRKIIVAQSQDLLLSAMGRLQLDDCAIAGHAWSDLGKYPPGFLSRLWSDMATAANVPTLPRQQMADALQNGDVVLEPGCLQYLAHSDEPLENMQIDDAVRLARQPARDLGLALASDRQKEKLLRSLAIASTSHEPIALRELAFAMNGDLESLPGMTRGEFASVQFGGTPPARKVPAYATEPKLDAETELNLENLERRGLVAPTHQGLMGLSHPFYRAAAESILYDSTSRAASEALDITQRALFCLAPATSRAAARNLDWLYQALANRVEQREKVTTICVEGLRSIFPATRDLCFLFLLRHLPVLKDELRRDLPAWTRTIAHRSLRDVRWRDGEAVFPSEDVIDGREVMLRSLERVKKADVVTELSILDSNQDGYLSPERAAAALTYLKSKPIALTARAMGRLLSYHEAMIRAEAVRIWLSASRTDDAVLLARIFDDESPSVVRTLFKGAFAGWEGFPDARKTVVREGLIRVALNPFSALVLIDELVIFNRVEHYGDHPAWPVFEALMPVVLRALPTEADIIEARLFDVVKEASAFLSVGALVSIVGSWITWIERVLASGALPDEYALGVSEILLKATKNHSGLRNELVSRLFALQGTSALMVVLSDFVEKWDDLVEAERALIIDIITRDRQDRRWLQALVLTRRSVPSELQKSILGDAITLSVAPSRLIQELPAELLEASVAAYCGKPQPLWALGTHHAKGSVWEQVVRQIALLPDHPKFETAFAEIILTRSGKDVAEIVTHVGSEHLEKIFDILLQQRIDETGNYLSEAWEALFGRADEETKERWLDRIVGVANFALDDLDEVEDWLTGSTECEALLRKLPGDNIPLMLLYGVKNLNPDGIAAVRGEAAKTLKATISKWPPLLHGTYDRILRDIDLIGIDDAQLGAMLKAGRAAVFEARRPAERSYRSPTAWIDP
ncbi:hypothetical protein [Bradyrhizobium yuanmingense]|uniref:nSTAND3 domain-containing NTPase n=1 Tax=Bradyrhizobium yuanmingense TaxID=108015 RepID=UPI0023B98BC3|nr:hypothetical protein [Bradyrhizobium yuanmingense]MDF0492748.1 hypothetical protein [Bradyrhizobium yuanmingense]